MAGKESISAENKIALISGCGSPSIVDSQTDAPPGSRGIEFIPFAIYLSFISSHYFLINTKSKKAFKGNSSCRSGKKGMNSKLASTSPRTKSSLIQVHCN